jgi:hypothetical protein
MMMLYILSTFSSHLYIRWVKCLWHAWAVSIFYLKNDAQVSHDNKTYYGLPHIGDTVFKNLVSIKWSFSSHTLYMYSVTQWSVWHTQLAKINLKRYAFSSYSSQPNQTNFHYFTWTWLYSYSIHLCTLHYSFLHHHLSTISGQFSIAHFSSNKPS